MTAREELAKRIETNPLGWLPGVGDCINITFTPDEARVLTSALRGVAQNVPSSEALSHIDERLADLREANGIFEKSTRDQSRDILRNSREIRWLVDLRTMLISPTPIPSTSRGEGE